MSLRTFFDQILHVINTDFLFRQILTCLIRDFPQFRHLGLVLVRKKRQKWAIATDRRYAYGECDAAAAFDAKGQRINVSHVQVIRWFIYNAVALSVNNHVFLKTRTEEDVPS